MAGRQLQTRVRPWASRRRYRHLLDVDGNGWSSRLPMLLWSRALVLRAAVFSSFVDGLLEPWVHYGEQQRRERVIGCVMSGVTSG